MTSLLSRTTEGLVYRLESCPNPNVIQIHVKRRLSEMSITFYQQGGTDERPEWVRNVMAVEGVVVLLVDPYSVTISKGHAYEWVEILPLALFAIGSAA